jgi:hypothetical protein
MWYPRFYLRNKPNIQRAVTLAGRPFLFAWTEAQESFVEAPREFVFVFRVGILEGIELRARDSLRPNRPRLPPALRTSHRAGGH